MHRRAYQDERFHLVNAFDLGDAFLHGSAGHATHSATGLVAEVKPIQDT